VEESKFLMRFKNVEKMIVRYLNDNKNLMQGPPAELKIGLVPGSTQTEIVEYIIEHNESVIYQRDLEDVLHFSKASISDVLGTMEKNNLIIRNVDPKDSRNKIIKLASSAQSAYEHNKMVMDGFAKKIVVGITEEEMKVFNRVLDKIEKNIK